MASRPLRSEPAEIVALLSGSGRHDLARYLIQQRWFAAKTRGVGALAVLDWAVLDHEGPLVLLLLDVDGDVYYLPVAVAAGGTGSVITRAGDEVVIDAHDEPRFARGVLAAIQAARDVAGRAGLFRFRPTSGWTFPPGPATEAVRRYRGEQSNTSVLLGEALVLKSLRRPQPGVNPDLEITRFLTTRTGFRHSPGLAGWAEHEAVRESRTLAVLQEFVPNQGDGWTHVLAMLRERRDAIERSPDPLIEEVHQLAAITGALHASLAGAPADPDFAPEPVTRDDIARWAARIARDLDAADVRRLLAGSPGSGDAATYLSRALAALEGLSGTVKIRTHGDYHLGQTLKTRDAFAIIDFEGEPARPLAERRRRQAALRDVAGMLRSLDYAAHAVALEAPEAERAGRLDRLTAWEHRARRAFLGGYRDAVTASPVPLVPSSEAALLRACGAFEIEKACYELRYELDHRPEWVGIPLAGIRRILAPA